MAGTVSQQEQHSDENRFALKINVFWFVSLRRILMTGVAASSRLFKI
jgi:hypothetical protein